MMRMKAVLPAKAGIQLPFGPQSGTPASAGVTQLETSETGVI